MAPRILYQKPKGKDYEETFKYAGELLDRAGIADLSDVMPSELSGGEIRRMAVCRAMLLKPGIILADEPTGDLDEENTGTVMELLKDHVKAGGSVMVVTHDIQVRDYADILMEMKQGVIYPQ